MSTETSLRSLFTEWPPPGFRLAFSGDLAEITVPDVLSLLSQGRRSGLLVATASGIERGMAFVEGDILWARSEDAAEGADPSRTLDGLLANAAGGRFDFFRAPADFDPPGDRISTVELLLDCLRRHDEARSHAQDKSA